MKACPEWRLVAAKAARLGLFRRSDGELVRMLTGYPPSTEAFAFDPLGTRLALSTGNGDIRIWEIEY